MKSPHVALVFVFALLASVGAARDVTAQSCPSSEMEFRAQGMFTSDAATFDSTHAAFPTFRVAYDLVQGTVFVYHCCSLGITSVETGDAYDVTGVAPGTPVSLVAELLVDGEVWDAGGCGGSGCSGSLGMSIEHGVEIEEYRFAPTLFGGARLEFHGGIQLPVTIVAGVPEEIRFRLWGTRAPGGSHGATGTGRIRFLGLALGQSITSCHGYNADPTPVTDTSWGSVKAHYR
ncbi:MAG: hypothetical protein ACREOU_14665 [Candidatus Eiseniibacteriota bacterium]